ncbi:hypothetical protein FANTH_4022 [Fusarium anthophilum]|uniref:Zn(2)-C6 fungal-type domain-containing protein n=1 Tax=Fusarium anthophilum TaxID=48485 RepID=A0A8H4ZRD8_9HYPO|nr:hypothetical protein FANTH_4022 [Fusarium anthophilum]
MTTTHTEPSIRETRSYGSPPVAPGYDCPADTRYASFNANPRPGYQPPPGQPRQCLPPLQPHRRPPYRQEASSTEPYYTYYHGQPPPPPRRPPPHSHPAYRHIPAGVYKYPVGHGSAPPLTQAAQRPRTSIACKHCRKRKVRCSGYQSAGKCQNCARKNQECIFEPTSSSSSTALIPVSALPGGAPPGTQLFGAHGQPLALSTILVPPPTHVAHQSAPSSNGNYCAPVQSHAESLSSCGDPSADDGSQLAGRKRRRTSEDLDEGYRLPPPRGALDGDLRRRSPVEIPNDSSPDGVAYPPYQGARQGPRNPTSDSLPQAVATGSCAASTPGGCSPTVQTEPDGAFIASR